MHPSQCSPYTAERLSMQLLYLVGARLFRRHVHTQTAGVLSEPAKDTQQRNCQETAFGSLRNLSDRYIAGGGVGGSGAVAAGRTSVAGAVGECQHYCCWCWCYCCYCCCCCRAPAVALALTLVQNAFDGGEVVNVCSAFCFLSSSDTVESCVLMANSASTVHSRPTAIIRVKLLLCIGLTIRRLAWWETTFCSASRDLFLSIVLAVHSASRTAKQPCKYNDDKFSS